MGLWFSGHRLCDEPSPVENGYIIGNEFWVGQNITYKCNKGYWLRGPLVRVCNETTGNWSMEAPKCEGELEIQERRICYQERMVLFIPLKWYL